MNFGLGGNHSVILMSSALTLLIAIDLKMRHDSSVRGP